MKDKDKKMLFGIGIVFLFLASIGFSYAYFTSAIAQNEVKDQVVETGTLSLRYVDGAEIVMNNIKPGDIITKTVYVANTGTLDAVYNLVWQELTNEITNDEMLIEGTCTRMNATTEVEDGTCEAITSAAISSSSIKSKITIEPSIVHKYDLTITFKDTNAAQNYNQSKKFSGVLGVNEYQPTQFEKNSWETIATNVRNGNISNYNLGDTKEVVLEGLGKHNVRIANTSTPSECSTEGFSQTACGFVLEFEDIITNRNMNSTKTNDGGWPASAMYTYVNTDLYNILPTDLKNVIIDTTVVSGHGSSNDNNLTSIDKLYLLAPSEIYSDWSSNGIYDSASDTTRQLDFYFKKNVSISLNTQSASKYNDYWWLRTAHSKNNTNFFRVNNSGGPWYNCSSTELNGISPAFRIG